MPPIALTTLCELPVHYAETSQPIAWYRASGDKGLIRTSRVNREHVTMSRLDLTRRSLGRASHLVNVTATRGSNNEPNA